MTPEDRRPDRYCISVHRVRGGYVARVANLPGCACRGVSPVEAVEKARNAIRAWIEIAAAVTREPAIVEIEISA